MKKGLLLIGFLLVYSLTARSQINKTGTPLISWFDAADTPGDLCNLSITMDKRGVMFFGNETNGIVTYDGSSWDMISMNNPQKVISLATDTRGIVYVGGESDFGFLQPDLTGRLAFCSLAPKTPGQATPGGRSPVTSIASDSNKVYFADGRGLYIYDIRRDTVAFVDLANDYDLQNAGRLVIIDRRIIIADNIAGLFEYAEGKITPLPGGDQLRLTRFVRLLPYDSDNILIGTVDKGLVTFNLKAGTLNNRFLEQDDNSRLMKTTLTDVAILPGSMIAAGLADGGGVYIFSHDGRLLQHISDRTTPIRESSVTSMYCDYTSNSQLWFCTKGLINRAYVSLPASEFGNEAGIISVAGSFAEFRDSVYTGTDAGLYKNYADLSGVMRFRKLEHTGTRINALVTTNLPDGEVLLSATDDGLWQTDESGDMLFILKGVHLTAVSPDADSDLLVTGSDDGIIRTLEHSAGLWKVKNTCRGGEVTGYVKAIIRSDTGEWWIQTTSPSSVIRMNCEASDTTFTLYGRGRGIGCDTISNMIRIDNSLYLCTGKGLFRFNPDDDTFVRDHDLIGNTFDNIAVNNLIKTPEGDVFLSGFDTRNFNALVRTTRQGHIVFRRQFDFLPDVPTTGMAFIQGNIWIAKGRSIFVIDNTKLGFSYGAFSVFFTRIASGRKLLMDGSFYTLTAEGIRVQSACQPEDADMVLSHTDNNITFRWTTTSYVGEENTVYRCRLDPFDKNWSDWQDRTYSDYTNLPPGDYTFRLMAKTITGLDSEERTCSFSVKRPWYLSLPAVILYIAALSVILFVVISRFLRKIKKLNARLDNLLTRRSEAVERRDEEMVSLEHYSAILLEALQPSEKTLGGVFPNSFIMSKPQLGVSGDFRWMKCRPGNCTLAVGDCTGHGVSSALTILTILTLLDEKASGEETTGPSAMLSFLHERLAEIHDASSKPQPGHGGTDIAMLAIDRDQMSAEFAGAALQCYKVTEMSNADVVKWKNGEQDNDIATFTDGKYRLETVAGDRMPLGTSITGTRVFTSHEWKLERDTSYYIFTDGYTDQFNGVTGKKFMKKNFRKLILDIQRYPMRKQKEILEERLGSWMGASPQTDDITIVGFRID